MDAEIQAVRDDVASLANNLTDSTVVANPSADLPGIGNSISKFVNDRCDEIAKAVEAIESAAETDIK